MPPQAMASYSSGLSASASLDDHVYEEKYEPFFQWHADSLGEENPGSPLSCRVIQRSPRSIKVEDEALDTSHIAKQWIQGCKASFQDEEWAWWPCVHHLMDGSDESARSLMRRLLAMWHWAASFDLTMCPPCHPT